MPGTGGRNLRIPTTIRGALQGREAVAQNRHRFDTNDGRSAVILVVFWLLGLIFHILGAFIHVVLVIAIIVFIISFLMRR